MNGTIQKKKDSLSDFQGLLSVFECVVVIITQGDSHTTRIDLHIVMKLSIQGTQNHACVIQ